jgi:septal ring factor EnvC (AmiA/AmiB activator)
MKKRLKVGSLLLFLPLFISCGMGRQLPSLSMASEAKTLKTYCEQINLQSPDVKQADQFYADANVQLQQNRHEEAYSKMDLAAIYYRLALSKMELEDSKAKLQEASRKLNNDENQLNAYLEILQGMGKAGK